jgi:hypothetical protein
MVLTCLAERAAELSSYSWASHTLCFSWAGCALDLCCPGVQLFMDLKPFFLTCCRSAGKPHLSHQFSTGTPIGEGLSKQAASAETTAAGLVSKDLPTMRPACLWLLLLATQLAAFSSGVQSQPQVAAKRGPLRTLKPAGRHKHCCSHVQCWAMSFTLT